MKIPAHRRKRDPFRKQILGIRKPPPVIPRCEECDKQAYSNKAQALVFAARSTSHGSSPLRVYRCPRGNGWHLTSMPKAA